MPSGNVLIVAVVAAGLWFGGKAAVHGVKNLGHKIEHVFKHEPKQTEK